MPDKTDQTERFLGSIQQVIFSADAGDYCVVRFSTEDDEFTACGYLPSIKEDLEYEIQGVWKDHVKYGRQVHIKSASLVKPESKEAIERYLASGIIPGIGPKVSEAIVKVFGLDSFNIIEKEPEELLKVSGIGQKTLEKIISGYTSSVQDRADLMFFQKIGISNLMIGRVMRDLGENARAKIEQNPYILMYEVAGFGFRKSDQVAEQLGVEPESMIRVEAMIIHVLEESLNSGNTYIPKTRLLEKFADTEINPDTIEDAMMNLLISGKVFMPRGLKHEDALSLGYVHTAEQSVAAGIAVLLQSAKPVPRMDSFLEKYEEKRSIKFDQLQKQAIELAYESGVYIITGGPGTGKTTIINALINLYEYSGKKVALCAPTGRAAKRMADMSDRAAQTIHRMLEFNGIHFGKTAQNPIKEDVVIVDEISMVDIFLMNRLVDAMPPGTALVMVGDKDQLPSVGPGSVLRDLLKFPKIRSIKLEHIFRQSKESSIASNAHKINRGDMPVYNEGSDFYFIEKHTDVAGTIVDLVSRRLKAKYQFDPVNDIQVLGMVYKGSTGVNTLNIELRKALNPEKEGLDEVQIGIKLFRCGDKVMQTSNNYMVKWMTRDDREGEGVFNGDIGTILEIDKIESVIYVDFEDRVAKYEYSEAIDLTLAYAVTVHKSQGSEFKCIVMPMSRAWNMNNRNILYTAITRAKELVVLVGSKAILEEMVRNKFIDQRLSMLHSKLCEYFDAMSEMEG